MKYAEVATHAAAAEECACDHRDERNLCAAGDKGGGHDRHTAVALILDGTGCHDAGDAAAGADQHRDEGLAGQTELAEDTVKDECDTGHVAAGLKECEEQEQHEHLRNEAEDCADTGDDTVKDQTVTASSAAPAASSAIADQNRNAGNPNAVVQRDRARQSRFLQSSSQRRDRTSAQQLRFLLRWRELRIVVDRHIVDGKGSSSSTSMVAVSASGVTAFMSARAASASKSSASVSSS